MDKQVVITIPKELTYGRGYVYSLQYHIVWCTKYRHDVLKNGIDNDVKLLLNDISKKYKFDIMAMEVMPDHIHLLVDCKPQFCIATMMKIIKGTIARKLFIMHPELKAKLWGGHLWNPTYFVCTVSERSLSDIERYIMEQKSDEAK